MENRVQGLLVKKFGASKYHPEHGHHVLNIDINELPQTALYIKDELDFILLLDICAVDNLKRQKISTKRFELIYHFLNMESHDRLRLKIDAEDDEWIPSIKKQWSNAAWYEREIVDLMGLKFSDSSYQNLLLPEVSKYFPLRKDFNDELNEEEFLNNYYHYLDKDYDSTHCMEQWIENNSMISGNARFRFWLENNKIKRAKVDIGYHHRGIEKLFEQHYFEQGTLLTNHLNYYSSAMNNLGWCKAVEEFLNIEITDRAKCLRMIFSELARVVEHLNSLGCMGTTLKVLPFEKYLIEQREKIYTLFERVTGARFDLSISRIGGMTYDLPNGWISDCINVIRSVQDAIERYSKILIQSDAWMSKCRIGQTTAYEAIENGFTGPNLRAAGVNYDIRKSSPYYFYDQVDFDVVVGTSGDCYDRFLIRLEEIKQSLRIISQVLDNIPPGEIRIFSKELHGEKTADINQFCKLLAEPIKVSAGDIYSSTEVANGELGFYISTEDSTTPYRVKIRTPGFSLLQSYETLVLDKSLLEARAILSSLNIVMSEIDR